MKGRDRLGMLLARLLLAGALLAGQWQVQVHPIVHEDDDDGHAVVCQHCLTLAAVQVLPPLPLSPIALVAAARPGAPVAAVPMGLTLLLLPDRPPIRAPPATLLG